MQIILSSYQCSPLYPDPLNTSFHTYIANGCAVQEEMDHGAFRLIYLPTLTPRYI